jgi:hypothetical protein
LQPGEKPRAAIRDAAAHVNLSSEYNADVRLPGRYRLPMRSSRRCRGSLLNGVLTAAIVLLILWLALQSLRIVLPVVVSLLVGLAVTADQVARQLHPAATGREADRQCRPVAQYRAQPANDKSPTDRCREGHGIA